MIKESFDHVSGRNLGLVGFSKRGLKKLISEQIDTTTSRDEEISSVALF